MSDTTEREAVLEEFCPQRYRESPWQTFRKIAAEDMADEILRLRAAVEQVRALHHNRMRGSYTCAECRDDYPCPTIRALEVGRE